MTDDRETGDRRGDDVVFNTALVGGAAASQQPIEAGADALADEVGLETSRIAGNPEDRRAAAAKLFEDAKLPQRQTISRDEAPVFVPPSAPPVGASAPVTALPIDPMAGTARQIDSLAHDRPPVAAGEAVRAGATEGARSPVVSLHTMKDDLQEVVRREKVSAVRAASLEAQKRAARNPSRPIGVIVPPRPKSHRALVMLTAIAVFMGLGGAALYGVHLATAQKPAAPAPAPSILFAEQQTALPVGGQTSDAVKGRLATLMAQQAGGNGSILRVVPELPDASGERPATLQEFLASMGAYPPDELTRALSTDFFFGIQAADIPSAVFVIPVTSYDHAFAGMLAWEGEIDAQLAPLFKSVAATVPAASTSTLPAQRTFADSVMRNYDVRVLRDDGGAVVLYYSFPTQNILVISGSPDTFPELLSRLAAQRRL